MSRPIAVLVSACASAVSCAYAPAPRPLRLEGGEHFTLAPGEQAVLNGTGGTTTVRLRAVDERSACKLGELCPGRGASSSRVLVDIDVPGQSYETLALPVAGPDNPMTPDTAPCVPATQRRIHVTEVTPKPDLPRPQSVYLVTFRAAERC